MSFDGTAIAVTVTTVRFVAVLFLVPTTGPWRLSPPAPVPSTARSVVVVYWDVLVAPMIRVSFSLHLVRPRLHRALRDLCNGGGCTCCHGMRSSSDAKCFLAVHRDGRSQRSRTNANKRQRAGTSHSLSSSSHSHHHQQHHASASASVSTSGDLGGSTRGHVGVNEVETASLSHSRSTLPWIGLCQSLCRPTRKFSCSAHEFRGC